MKGLLVRVGADQSSGGGSWNGPFNVANNEFAYIPIPESRSFVPDCERPYTTFLSALNKFSWGLPSHLSEKQMHLDPDFEHLTYGDQGERAKQIEKNLSPGDLIVFYSGLSPIPTAPRLVYALIGIYVIDEIVAAQDVPSSRCDENAHTRRVGDTTGHIVVRGRPGVSGRLAKAIPIGAYRAAENAPEKRPCYRVDARTLKAWGGLNINDGFIQRSARLPLFNDALKFYEWLQEKNVPLVQMNN